MKMDGILLVFMECLTTYGLLYQRIIGYLRHLSFVHYQTIIRFPQISGEVNRKGQSSLLVVKLKCKKINFHPFRIFL